MRWWLLGFAAVCSVSCLACHVVDDLGHKIHLDHSARRIVSLAPDMTELLFAAGAGSYIVGVVQGSDFPQAAAKIPVVADYHTVNSEALLKLQPDLIVTWASSPATGLLRQLGYPVFVSFQQDLLDIPKTLLRFGCLAGTQSVARTAAKSFTQRYLLLRRRYSTKKKVSVFFQVWSQPLLTINHASWINQIISLCGGDNIFTKAIGVAPQVSMEGVLLADPQVILSPSKGRAWRKPWLAWPKLTAVKADHLFELDPDSIERAGPRVLDGAQQMCQLIDQSR